MNWELITITPFMLGSLYFYGNGFVERDLLCKTGSKNFMTASFSLRSCVVATVGSRHVSIVLTWKLAQKYFLPEVADTW
jgi:hypothetical protein